LVISYGGINSANDKRIAAFHFSVEYIFLLIKTWILIKLLFMITELIEGIPNVEEEGNLENLIGSLT
jgi:hypothetical protein